MKFRMRYAHSSPPPPARAPAEHLRRGREHSRSAARNVHLAWPADTSLRLLLRAAAGMTFFVFGYMKFFDTIPLGTSTVALPLGPEGFAQYLAAVGVPLPLLSAYSVCLVEMICGPGLVLSAFLPAPAWLTRLCALPLMTAMLVATLTVGVRNLMGYPVLLHGVAVTAQAWRFPLEAWLMVSAMIFVWKPLPTRTLTQP